MVEACPVLEASSWEAAGSRRVVGSKAPPRSKDILAQSRYTKGGIDRHMTKVGDKVLCTVRLEGKVDRMKLPNKGPREKKERQRAPPERGANPDGI